MKKKNVLAGISFALVLAGAVYANQYKVVGEKGDFYFGHISYVDAKDEAAAPAVFRWGAQSPETAVLNLPLGPGDVVQTSDGGRCEIQFDNGSIVRLDVNTKLKIETILAQTLSTSQKVSNLLLAQGQVYVMHKKYSPLEIFQVITPGASVKLSNNAVALIDLDGGRTAVQVERGRAELLYGRNEQDLDQKKVNTGERFSVGADNIVQTVEYAAVSEFMSWNEKVNANFAALHEGNVLPKPLQKLPPAVFEFAQKFGNLHGEWIWHDLYGYVWRPFINDFRYPWGSWQPYFYGNWSNYNGQLYWVPGEPWGWVPYHLGLWMWDEKSGWVWMPGSLFAPAWVTWEFYSGHYFWRPFSLYDYYFDSWVTADFLAGYLYGTAPLSGPLGTLPSQSPSTGAPVRTIVNKDQLKNKGAASLPVPKELKGALRATADALKNGDARVQASLRGTLRQSVIISKTEFGKPGWQEKTVSLDRFLESPEVKAGGAKSFDRIAHQYVARDALRSYEAARAIRDIKPGMDPAVQSPGRQAPPDVFRFGRERPDSLPDAAVQNRGGVRTASPAAGPGRISRGEEPGNNGLSRPGMRFRDWNPDVRAAVRLGVDIAYSSRTNEVYSSELGLRSRDIMPRAHFSPGFQLNSPDSGSSASIGAGGSASSGPGQTSGASPAGSSGPRGSSKEGGSGKQN
ncbi:MAG: hypothetical protein A2W03_10155 [Candidatus Aminicenantes bacterium RBG_16_63_16]|nr:MAG: hypothetical protein A2W03_10155 [Candidatus Aminicenantes bacterium RBG_16_63_16]